MTTALLAAAMLVTAPTARAQLEVRSNQVVTAVFGGGQRSVPVTFHNAAAQPLEINLRTQLYQATSATTVRLGRPEAWKKLAIAADQTVLESVTLDLPAVNGVTRFVVQWLDGGDKVMGTTSVLAHPTNILEMLRPLAGGNRLGVFDPQNELKPLLASQNVEFDDLAETGVSAFTGQLAIICPARETETLPENLAARLAALAKSGKAVLWLQFSPEDKLTPSFYQVTEGRGAVVVAQPDLVAGLVDRPGAQLNLIALARLARHPEPFQLSTNPSKE